MSVAISRATRLHIEEMLPFLRSDDALEVRAEGFVDPYHGLEVALELSGSQAWTTRRRGKIMAMWGVIPINLLNGVGVPWLLTTDEVDQHPRDFLRASREAIRFLRERHSFLWNRVDARYEKALRWARRVGFEVGPPIVAQGYRFCLITMRGA